MKITDKEILEAYREKNGVEVTDDTPVYAFREDETMSIGNGSERDRTRWYSLQGPNPGYFRKNLIKTKWGELIRTAEKIEYDPSSAPGKIVNVKVIHIPNKTPEHKILKHLP